MDVAYDRWMRLSILYSFVYRVSRYLCVCLFMCLFVCVFLCAFMRESALVWADKQDGWEGRVECYITRPLPGLGGGGLHYLPSAGVGRRRSATLPALCRGWEEECYITCPLLGLGGGALMNNNTFMRGCGGSTVAMRTPWCFPFLSIWISQKWKVIIYIYI